MTSVRMIARGPEDNGRLVERFAANCLRYEGHPFMGLVSPTSTLIPETAAERLREHVAAVDAWARGVAAVYAGLLDAGDDAHPMLRMLEWGLDRDAVRLQRASAIRGDRPVAARMDCVDLGSDNFIAEVQWKGAGEGWTASIDRSYREVFPMDEGHQGLGDLVRAWAEVFRTDGCAVNTGRLGWMDAEEFLMHELRALGTTLVSRVPADVQALLDLGDGGVPAVAGDGTRQPLRHLFLDRLTEVIDVDVIDRLVEHYVAGELVLDPPPSYVFNEKLPMALPFTDGYREHFDDAVRRALVPSVLVTADAPRLGGIVPYVRSGDAAMLGDVRTWDDVLALPSELRGDLVLKCGSADQWDNHGGHGVFRLDGETGAAREVLGSVLGRVRDTGEPWVVQPYLGNRWRVPVAHLDDPFSPREMDLHAKFGIYFRLPHGDHTSYDVLGGIATMSTSWKVSGASKTPATVVADGTLAGAFRHDIRVETGR